MPGGSPGITSERRRRPSRPTARSARSTACAQARHHVVAVDRPGHGHSDRPAFETPGHQADLIHRLLRQLRIVRPVIVGHSWGGALALIHAVAYPDDVAGLVLVGTRARVQPAADDTLRRIVRVPIVGDVLRHTFLVPLGRGIVEQGLADAYAPEPVPPDAVGEARALWLRPGQVAATVVDTELLQIALVQYEPRFASLQIPVTILVGDADSLLPESLALHAQIPHATLRVLPGTGHMVPRTQPSVIAQAVADVRAAAGLSRAGR
ncbi:MAG TPA: alpha/beta hydrolase [Vicinamibacterales bacterium]|nr:alpha/beta hydrolase [Vicinamibacterales bacterium]